MEIEDFLLLSTWPAMTEFALHRQLVQTEEAGKDGGQQDAEGEEAAKSRS